MTRSKEHQEFLDIHHGRKEDPDPNDLETTATPEEIEWWNKQKLWELRCLAQSGDATPSQLLILAKKGFSYPTTPKEYIKKLPTLWDRRKKAQAGEASDEDLKILAKAGYFYPTTPDEYRPKKTKK